MNKKTVSHNPIIAARQTNTMVEVHALLGHADTTQLHRNAALVYACAQQDEILFASVLPVSDVAFHEHAAIQWAVFHGDLAQLIRMLPQASKKANTHDWMQQAIARGHKDVVHALLLFAPPSRAKREALLCAAAQSTCIDGTWLPWLAQEHNFTTSLWDNMFRLACFSGQSDSVAWLLEHPQKPIIQNDDLLDACLAAAQADHTDLACTVLHYLSYKNTHATAIFETACARGNEELMTRVFPHVSPSSTSKALKHVCAHPQLGNRWAQPLLETMNIRASLTTCVEAMGSAIESSNSEMVQALLPFVDIELTQVRLWGLACTCNNVQVLRLLAMHIQPQSAEQFPQFMKDKWADIHAQMQQQVLHDQVHDKIMGARIGLERKM